MKEYATWILLENLSESMISVPKWNDALWIFSSSPSIGYIGAYGKAAVAYPASNGAMNKGGVAVIGNFGARQKHKKEFPHSLTKENQAIKTPCWVSFTYEII